MSQLCLSFAQNQIETTKLFRFCQARFMTIEENPNGRTAPRAIVDRELL
jgi:hypothetical protein